MQLASADLSYLGTRQDIVRCKNFLVGMFSNTFDWCYKGTVRAGHAHRNAFSIERLCRYKAPNTWVACWHVHWCETKTLVKAMLVIMFETTAAAACATGAPASKSKKLEKVAGRSKSCKPPVSRWGAYYECNDCLQKAQKNFLSPLWKGTEVHSTEE